MQIDSPSQCCGTLLKKKTKKKEPSERNGRWKFSVVKWISCVTFLFLFRQPSFLACLIFFLRSYLEIHVAFFHLFLSRNEVKPVFICIHPFVFFGIFFVTVLKITKDWEKKMSFPEISLSKKVKGIVKDVEKRCEFPNNKECVHPDRKFNSLGGNRYLKWSFAISIKRSWKLFSRRTEVFSRKYSLILVEC